MYVKIIINKMGIILSAIGYYQSNENNPQKEITPFDVKLLMLSIITRLTLYKNKTIHSIKDKIQKIIIDLKQNNINVASPKMETVLSEEDLIDVYSLLITSTTILHEQYKTISSSTTCPKHLEKHLQNLIYASKYLSIEDGDNFRELMVYKYGESFVQEALDNKNFCIDYRIVNAVKLNKKNELLIVLRLKQLAKQYEIKCEFPMDMLVDPMNVDYIEVDNANPYSEKNSRLFEQFEKDNLNRDDFIVDKVKNMDNGFVVVESEFDMEKLNNYCNTNDIRIKTDIGKGAYQIEQTKQIIDKEKDVLINENNNKEVFIQKHNVNADNENVNCDNRNLSSKNYPNINAHSFEHIELNEVKKDECNMIDKEEKEDVKNIVEDNINEQQENINNSKTEENDFVNINAII